MKIQVTVEIPDGDFCQEHGEQYIKECRFLIGRFDRNPTEGHCMLHQRAIGHGHKKCSECIQSPPTQG